jgi:hypothetical protein
LRIAVSAAKRDDGVEKRERRQMIRERRGIMYSRFKATSFNY